MGTGKQKFRYLAAPNRKVLGHFELGGSSFRTPAELVWVSVRQRRERSQQLRSGPRLLSPREP